MSKDTARLSRLGVLAPAALAACADASVLAVPAAGAIVSTLIGELSKAFMLKKWFHGAMSAREAEVLLMEHGKSGSYLVRESRARAGALVLSVRARARVAHVEIHEEHNKYDVGSGEQFDDLAALIEHCRAYPLRDLREGAGTALRLLQPVGAGAARARRARRPTREVPPDQLLDTKDSQLLDDEYGFDREFQSIRMLERNHVFTTIEGNRPENVSKNRYNNIIPYDQTRVVLRTRAGGSEYINASYVRAARLSACARSVQSSTNSLHSVQSLPSMDEILKIPTVSKSLSDEAFMEVKQGVKLDLINGNLCKETVKDKFYVATQGCLSNTKDDFWRMIWQEDIRIIAMITNEVEKGKEKCERYWPPLGLRERYGPLVVRAAAEERHGDHVRRELDVGDDAGLRRTVYQFQFTAWPDHSTPAEPDGVLAFLEEVNKRMIQIKDNQNTPEHNILCVHCSAGVGRTGTFIVLDMLIDQIKSSTSCILNKAALGGVTCVPSAVRLARAQRAGMVQTRAQYRFLYRALGTYVVSRKIAPKRQEHSAEALF